MKYRSEIAQMLHENAVDLFNVGLMGKDTMQQFDKLCDTDQRETPSLTEEEIAAFVQIEQKAKSMTINDLVAQLNIK